MWTYEHSIESDAPPEAIWRLWADVERWGAWNADIDKIEIYGPFEAGTEFTMAPAGQDPVRLRLAEVVEGEAFVDEAAFEGLVLRTVHRIERLDAVGLADGPYTRVTYRMEITGPNADELGPQIGPAVTGDWPETMSALIEHAKR
jgi:hypothetical protein